MLFPTLLVAAVLHCAGTNDPRCPLFGDVNGDGRIDRVAVARIGACQFVLVVRTSRRVLRTPVPEPFCRGKPSEFWRSGFPRVIALRPMNSRRGLEPEVLTWSGASNNGLRFFTFFNRRLRPMRIRPEPFPKDEWNVGGFADSYSFTDCIRRHVVGRAGASYDLHEWNSFGEMYRVTDNAFVRIGARFRRTRADPLPNQLRPRVRGDQFNHCGGIVRAPSVDP